LAFPNLRNEGKNHQIEASFGDLDALFDELVLGRFRKIFLADGKKLAQLDADDPDKTVRQNLFGLVRGLRVGFPIRDGFGPFQKPDGRRVVRANGCDEDFGKVLVEGFCRRGGAGRGGRSLIHHVANVYVSACRNAGACHHVFAVDNVDGVGHFLLYIRAGALLLHCCQQLVEGLMGHAVPLQVVEQFEQAVSDAVLFERGLVKRDQAEVVLLADMRQPPGLLQHIVQQGRFCCEKAHVVQCCVQLVVGDQLPDVLDKMGGRHALILRVAWASAGRQAASMIPASKVTNCPVVGRQKSGGDHFKQAKNPDFLPHQVCLIHPNGLTYSSAFMVSMISLKLFNPASMFSIISFAKTSGSG